MAEECENLLRRLEPGEMFGGRPVEPGEVAWIMEEYRLGYVNIEMEHVPGEAYATLRTALRVEPSAGYIGKLNRIGGKLRFTPNVSVFAEFNISYLIAEKGNHGDG